MYSLALTAPSIDFSLTAMVAEVHAPGFWARVAEMIGIDILLAGDNALVIALACRRLPPGVRLWGMALGAATAVILRIAFTLTITALMTLSYIKLFGGVALFYIAFKLMAQGDDAGDHIREGERLWEAVRIIAVADLVMSLDNVIALAAASKGQPLTFAFGLTASVPLVVAGAGMVMALFSRYPVLIWIGGGLLGWVAADVIASDAAISLELRQAVAGSVSAIAPGTNADSPLIEWLIAAFGAILMLGLGYVFRPQLLRSGQGPTPS